MRHIIPISGKDSLATALVQIKRQPDLPYELMFNPTGAETPEVDAWLTRAETHLGIPIQRVGANLENIIDEQGILPSMQARFCTRLAKIYPMEDWIGNTDATVYYGIRADEKRTGYINTKKPNIIPAYPLVEEGIGLDAVWQLLNSIDLLPPRYFWASLYDEVVLVLRSQAHLIDRLNPVAKQQLFSWRTRMNCSFCFFQRAYEWVGLLEHHPDLFWHAVEMEETIGGDGYTWRYKQPLRELAEKADAIRLRRAKRVAKVILKLFAPVQLSLFDLDDDDDQDTPDLLQSVSCGLFCGK
jgi:hypothetical protein